MEQIITLSEESQYNEILRQAVAVIKSARSKAASATICDLEKLLQNSDSVSEFCRGGISIN